MLVSQSAMLSAEFRRFNQLQHSLMAESRLTRQQLADYLQHKIADILTAARDARVYAMNALLTQVDATGLGNAEQLAYWTQNYQIYAQHFRAVDGEPDKRLLVGNPLARALLPAREKEPDNIRLVRAMLHMADTLGTISTILVREKKRVEPEQEDDRKPFQESKWKHVDDSVKNVMQGIKGFGLGTRNTLSRLSSRATHALLPGVYTEGLNRAIKNSAMLMLDEIQQTERQIKQIPALADLMGEAVEQRLRVSHPAIGDEELPVLSVVLNQQLAEETMRWQGISSQAQEQLEALIKPVTRWSSDERKEKFYGTLSEILGQTRRSLEPDRYKDMQKMDKTIREIAEALSGLAREVNGSVVRLAGHGYSGGKALRGHARQWLIELNRLKATIKNRVVDITGHSLDNFSRSGMLVRGISEWAETVKREYLQGISSQEKHAAAMLFDQAFLEVASDSRSHFAKKSDPQSEGFLRRLTLALQHAADNATVYPPTAEEILAGSRSLPEDIRRWAERKVVSGALSAIVRGGFRMVTGPFSLPVRVVLRGTRTGVNLYRGVHAINRVRLGEGPAVNVKNRFINRELSKIGFRLTLSLSPAVSMGIATTVMGARLYQEKDRRKKVVKRIVLNLPEELLWSGGYIGAGRGINAAVKEYAEQAIRRQVEEAFANLGLTDEFDATDKVDELDDTEQAQPPAGDTVVADVLVQASSGAATNNKAARLSRPKRFAGVNSKPVNLATTVMPASTAIYPLLPRKSVISAALSKKIKADFPVADAHRAGVAKVEGVKNSKAKIYHSGKRNYLYAEGQYHYISNIKYKSKGIVTAQLYPTDSTKPNDNSWVPIIFESRNNVWAWYLGRDQDAAKGSESKNQQVLTHTLASAELIAAAKTWKSNVAFSYSEMASGWEGRIYADAEKHFIFLNNFYWPVQMQEDSNALITIGKSSEGVPQTLNIWLVDNQWSLKVKTPAKKEKPKVVTPSPATIPTPIPDAITTAPTIPETVPVKTATQVVETAKPAPVAPAVPTYPLLPRASIISADLIKKVRADFPASGAYRAPVAKVEGTKNNKPHIYHTGARRYLYIDGQYYYIGNVRYKSQGIVTAQLYLTDSTTPNDNNWLPIIFEPRNYRWAWYLGREEDAAKGDAGKQNNQILTSASTGLIAAAKKWSADKTLNYSRMISGREGQLYADGDKYYIFLNKRYWPVQLQKDNSAVISPGKQRAKTLFRKTGSNIWELKEQPGHKGSSAILSEEARRWGATGINKHKLPVSGVEGEIYKESDGKHYIYISRRYWLYTPLSDDLGGVSASGGGQNMVVIINNNDGYWDFSEAVDATNFNTFAVINERMSKAEFTPATRQAIASQLAAEHFISFKNLINQLFIILDKEFSQLYTQPNDEKLKDILWLRNRLSQHSDLAPQTRNTDSNQDWDPVLLATYWDAFNVDAVDYSDLATARQARILANDAQVKLDKLNNTSVDKNEKKLRDINDEIESIKAEEKDEYERYRSNPDKNENVPYYYMRKRELAEKLKSKEAQQSIVRTIVDRTRAQKEKYQRVIKNYNEKYKHYDLGIKLGKEVFNQYLSAQRDKSDILMAAEESIIELAMKEVGIRSKTGFSNSAADLQQLRTLRIARIMIRNTMSQQLNYNDLVDKLANKNISKPILQNNYADIVWANKRAEELSKELYEDEEKPEVYILLPAMLYWLLKNKAEISSVKGLSATKLIDEYFQDRYSLNPLIAVKEMPEGYTALSEMLGSEYFESQLEYNQQFIEYKEKYSEWEASERSRELLAVSGLTLDEMSAPVKKRIRLNVTKSNNVKDIHAGELLFVQLEDGRWIFFSIFPEATFSRIFTDAQMHGSPWLKAIATLDPKKIHAHGLESVFDEAFFKQHCGHANEKNYWDSRRRATREKKELINGILYKKENDVQYPNPFANSPYGGLEYDFYEQETQPHDNLVKTLNISMQEALKRSADSSKAALYSPSILQRAAALFVPFYSEIYNAVTDPDYKPDAASILADMIGVFCVAAQVGMKVSVLVKNAKGIATLTREGIGRGLVGKSLYMHVVKGLGKQGIIGAGELAKISASTIYDLVDAFRTRDLINYAASKAKAAMNFNKVVPGKLSKTFDKGLIRKDVSLNDMQKQMLHGGEVYVGAVSPAGTRSYYINTSSGVCEVRWDETLRQWRTVDPTDPTKPGKIVRFEKGSWFAEVDFDSRLGPPEKGEQPQRTGLPKEKVTFNIPLKPETGDIPAKEYLDELYKLDSTHQAIVKPKERCQISMAPVAEFMRKKGFEDIRYRGIAIFLHAGDRFPGNHFVVVGRKNGKDYVFDLTAGQFASKYDELNGPIILPEELWAQKYANITSNTLIKYGDYNTAAKADLDFGIFSHYTAYGPDAIIPGAKVLRRPEWYFPKPLVDVPVAEVQVGTIKRSIIKKGVGSTIRATVRRGKLTQNTAKEAIDYAVDSLENSELLGKTAANTLREGIKKAVKSGQALTGSTDLFTSTRIIDSHEALLRVREGEMVFFMRVDPNMPEKTGRQIHVMVGLGNGRFTGVNNSVLNVSLGNDPRILTAEQLVEPSGLGFKLRGEKGNVQIIAGYPKGMLVPELPSLKNLASKIPANVNVDAGLTDILKQSGKLAPEQAQALRTALHTVITQPAPELGKLGIVDEILNSPVRVQNPSQLADLPAGHLVTCMPRDKSDAGHVIYSLGQGEFLVVNPGRLDASLAGKPAVMKATDLPEGIFTRNVVSSGEISLQKLRIAAFLGPGGKLSVEGSTLVIKASGGPGAVNHLDATELADVIRGLALDESHAIDLTKITEIKLQTSFGGLGKVPLGKALAYLLDKKVTVYPTFFSPELQSSINKLSGAKTYVPGDITAEEIALMTRQQSKNHDFWKRLRSLFEGNPIGKAEDISEELRVLLNNVVDYVRGNVSMEQFFEIVPEYTKGLLMIRAEINLLHSKKELGTDDYILRSTDVLNASSYAIELLQRHLSKV
ncbi:hypothetical protein AAEY27_08860 [Kosakonia sp. BYX6]|uniref:Tox-PLDMTX domain-containing protein n=1 Tax=Kosakonia calanthes TaxID=3139408 RepID=A0ABZ3B9K0_9ENTR